MRVGPFVVDPLDGADLVSAFGELLDGGDADRSPLCFGLHVSALNARSNASLVRAVNAADLVYADGNSIVALARLGGSPRFGSSVTTDIGHCFLAEASRRLGRPARVALVGGPLGLAAQAGARLSLLHDVEIVATETGYSNDWAPVVRRLKAAGPDVVVVGLGIPAENLWAMRWRHDLGGSVVFSCGGWFGYLAGNEPRAPSWLRRAHLEWVYRLHLAPSRLGPRYVRGVFSVLALMPGQLGRRLARS